MAVTKKEGDGNHPSSHYLVVEDATKPTTWHLRVRDASGKLDHGLMGAAWAALHGGYRGNKYQGPNKSQAISKLTKLYSQEGMPTPGGKSWLYKDKTGQPWFFGIYSNNFEDREKEIFSWDSHLEFTDWVKEMGVKLPVTIAHQPKYPPELHVALLLGLKSGMFTPQEYSEKYMKLYSPYAFAQTEAIIPINGFVLVVAKILNDKEKVVQLLNSSNWGMSHGFLAVDRDKEDPSVITQYRSFELTTLPTDMAANMLTVSSIKDNIMDATKALSDQDRETLKELLNTDPSELEEGLAEMQSILGRVFNNKELDVEEIDGEVNVEYDEIRQKIFVDLNVEALQKTINGIGQMLQSINQRLDEHDTRLKETELSEDEKISKALTDPFAQFNWELFDKSNEEEKPENAEELKDKALGDKPVEGVGEKNLTPDENIVAWQVANLFGGQ